MSLFLTNELSKSKFEKTRSELTMEISWKIKTWKYPGR